jgi:glycosyltransferase involved in cell wall biosynthesis
VLSNIGGAQEQVTNGINGFLFSPGDIEQLAAHLRRLLSAPLRQRMGESAATIVRERFALGTMISQYQSLLEHVTSLRVLKASTGSNGPTPSIA